MDCLFSFYAIARPYVFTFYVTFIPVTVCECHIELQATRLDLTCCDFHACRKRERKSDYQRRYRVFGDTGKSGQLLPM